jgi:hypothetical protein
MALTQAEILALDALSYEISDSHFAGKKLSWVLTQISHSSDLNMSESEFDQLKTLAANDSALANLEVVNVNPAHDSNNNMVFFEDPTDGSQYAIFAGTAADEWDDDATNQKQATQPTKIAMQKWLDSQPIKVPPGCTVSGHSDGGNDAMYLTIKDGAKISDCLSFNGEGFGDAFVQTNAADIADAKAKITCINCSEDPIDHIGNPEGWITSFLVPSIPMPADVASHSNLLDTLGYIAQCHGISSLFAHDANGNLELGLEAPAAGPDSFWLDLSAFTTNYIDNDMTPLELSRLGSMVDTIMANGGTLTTQSLLELLTEFPDIDKALEAYFYDSKSTATYNLEHVDPDRLGFATRDFTRATEDRLLAIASQVQRDAGSWVDEIGDAFESCVSWPIVKNMIEGTDVYWSMLLDSNNISRKQLKDLFDDVYTIDDNYGKTFNAYLADVAKVKDGLDKLVESLQV